MREEYEKNRQEISKEGAPQAERQAAPPPNPADGTPAQPPFTPNGMPAQPSFTPNGTPAQPPYPQYLPPQFSQSPPASKQEKRKHSGNKADFHKAFWPMLTVGLIVPLYLQFTGSYFFKDTFNIFGPFPLIVFIVGLVLRFTCEKKNHYLAKGFFWAGLLSVTIPLLIVLLLLGSCFLLLGGLAAS